MATPAQWDAPLSLPANPTIQAGAYSLEVGAEAVTGWHSHDLHQLQYAFEGIAEVETATARYLLPPQQAVWIPAGVEHSTTLTHVKAVSVFFAPEMGLAAGDRVRILAAAPVIREMILYAKRWPIGRETTDPMAGAFFEALAYLVVEWLDHETPLCLPTTRDPLIAAAMDYTNENLAEVTLQRVCAAVGTSERTLRRAFPAATGMSWRQYLLESRLLKSMALLAEDDENVLTIAVAVGFQSVSAFTRAFGRYAGETPTAYRRRIRTGHAATATAESWTAELAARSVRRWSHQCDIPRAV
ncbi:helix-turn-helix transcriptional regulator [Actinomadura rugatobispora]|uniref:AraC family transcriptional regulator n=1 Tax=Actinomadura rugatobispora TaxID=1994 RepID=A0ABW0ZZS4_9ACTN|nr:helix-turn-helix transcriptional regulator [Actinomadura rugatobispora]